MSLVTEDGTGLAGAESFVSVADADTYHSVRANAAWALLTTANKEAALRQATEYMDAVYAWAGTRGNDTQALGWPRYGVVVDGVSVDSDAVPTAIARACAELALRASSADLAPDVGRQKSREKVGPIEVEYSTSAPAYTTYRQIDAMLSRYIVGGRGASRFVERA